MAMRRIVEFLDGNGIKYVVIHHSPAYTAQEVAESVHIPGREVAKAVVVKLDGRLALAVVPATKIVDMPLLRAAAGVEHAQLADPADFAGSFEGCQRGTMPPIGHLFGMDTYAERSLAQEEFITFNAGTHTDVICMRFTDWRRLTHPKLGAIASAAETSPQTALAI